MDITKKSNTHRSAIAQAIVKVGKQETIDAVLNKTVPKGDVFEASRIAGLFGIKRTSDIIPDCHPLPIEYAAIRHSISGLEIIIETEVHTIYKTGVEVEAMHGASVVALTVYDMLKPIDKEIEILSIKLVTKKGGKSQYAQVPEREIRAAVVVCSDSISAGENNDLSGKKIAEILEKLKVSVAVYAVVPDTIADIQEKVLALCDSNIDLIIFTGGTGLSARDMTPEAIGPLLDREIPGISETIRHYGQQQMPYAMLSRSVAGMRGQTLILALPGSLKGAQESMDAVFPHVLHLFKVLENTRHD